MSLLYLKWLLGFLALCFLTGAVFISSSRRRLPLRRMMGRRNLLIIIGIVCLISSLSLHTYEQQYRKRTQQIEQQLLSQAKQQIKQQATFVQSWILDENSRAEKRLRHRLTTIVGQAIATASHLVEHYHDRMSKKQLTQMVIESLRPLRFSHGRGYLFATHMDGTELLFADHPELEGRNMLPMKDKNGVHYVQEMIRLCRQQGGGFVSYRISKPGSSSWDNRKIAYVQYFKPLNCFIGTGEYLDDFTRETRQQVIDKLHHLTTEYSLPIFGAGYSGISFFGPAKGQNVLDIQDQNGIYVVKELIRAAKRGGDFVRYQMPSELSNNSYNKMSYCLPVKGWQGYIGAGINLDEVTQNIAVSRNNLLKNITHQILQAAAFIPVIILFMWYVSRRYSMTIERNVATLKDSLHRAIIDHQPIDLRQINLDEFFAIAQTTNSMLEQRRQTEENLERLAHFDPLTGLANRNWAVECLEKIVQQPAGTPQWLFMVDLKLFKHINNAYGHDVGDQVLKTVAHRLQSLQPTPLLVARLSSNEFIVVVNLPSTAAAEHTATTLQEILRQPIHDEELSLRVDCYVIGIPLAQNSVSELLGKADITLRLVKTDNTFGDYLLYDEQLEQSIHKREQMEEALRHALIHPQQLELYFQPIWNLSDKTLKGFEALVRWHHPELGMVSPAEFIPLAEQRGMIVPLGRIIFERACQTLSHWLKLYPQLSNEQLRLSVNMAPQQFVTDNFIDEVQSLLERYSIPPTMLCIEITETSLMENPELAIQRINTLKGIGIIIAVDDFGTGYSSLSYLNQFETDTIKIDQTLVTNIDREYSVEKISAAIIGLAHDLNLQVVAEGIETAEQLALLQQLGCDAIQGFLIARPQPERQAEKILAQRFTPWPEIFVKKADDT